MREDEASRQTKEPRPGPDESDLQSQEPPATPRDDAESIGSSEKARTRIDTEDEVAEASDESFPASDPPSFTPGKG